MRIRINTDSLPEYFTVTLSPPEGLNTVEIPIEHLKFIERTMVDFHEAQRYLHALITNAKRSKDTNS